MELDNKIKIIMKELKDKNISRDEFIQEVENLSEEIEDQEESLLLC